MDNTCEVTQRPKTVKEFFRSKYFWRPFLSIVIGMLAGFIYHFLVNCKQTLCTFDGEMVKTILFWGFIGFWVTSSPCARARCKS